ncbi:hypothetical protein [Streptococcus sp. 11273D007BT]
MNLEKELKRQQRHFVIFMILCLLWIPYFALLMYWMSVDITFVSQMLLIILVIPAIFQPLFWYMMLGCLLATVTVMYRDKL